MAEQLQFDLGPVDVHRPDTSREERKLRKIKVKPGFVQRSAHRATAADQRDAMIRQQAKQLEAEELLQPDPLEVRRPVKGDVVEILYARSWPALGWAKGTVLYEPYEHFMSVQMHFNGRHIWSPYISRRERSYDVLTEKGPIWRWPPKEAA